MAEPKQCSVEGCNLATAYIHKKRGFCHSHGLSEMKEKGFMQVTNHVWRDELKKKGWKLQDSGWWVSPSQQL